MASQNLFINIKAGLGDWFTKMKKVNHSMTNLTRDANRSAKSVRGMNSSFKGLNTAISVAKIYALGRALADTIKASLDMIETVNLFSVSMGNMAESTQEVINVMHELYGLDVTNLQNSIGTFGLLSRSMGFSTEQAQGLAINISKLALDLASLTNVPINQVMGDLRSGLVGQSETVYKYGVDVTEAGIKAEAMAQGITKSVRNMSQGEKMALRYSTMLRRTTLAQGDFAKTINEPANQLKILSDRVTTLSRSFGSIFIPMLHASLPYLNAFAILLTSISDKIAILFGYTPPEVKDVANSLGEVGDEASDSADSIDALAKAMKNVTSGMDELNVIKPPSAITTGVGGESIIDQIKPPDYKEDENPIVETAKEIAKTLEVLNPLFMGMAEGLKSVTDYLGKFGKDKFFPWLKDVGLWMKKNPKALHSLGKGLMFMAIGLGAFVAVKAGLKILSGLSAVLGGGFGAIGSLLLLAGAFVFLADTMDWDIPRILNSVKEMVTGFIEGLVERLPDIIEAGKNLFGSLVEALPEIINTITEIAEPIITTLVTAFETYFPQIATLGSTLFTKLVEALPTFLPTIVGAIPKIIAGLLATITTLLPTIITGGVTLFTALIEQLPFITKTIVDVLPDIIDALVLFITNNLGLIIDAGVTLLVALIEELPKITTTITDVLPKIIKSIIKVLHEDDNLGKIIAAGITLFEALIDNIDDIIEPIAKALPALITILAAEIVVLAPKIVKAGITLFEALLEDLPAITKVFTDNLPAIMAALKLAFEKFEPMFQEIGVAFGKAIMKGIMSAGKILGDILIEGYIDVKTAPISQDVIDALPEGEAKESAIEQNRRKDTFKDISALTDLSKFSDILPKGDIDFSGLSTALTVPILDMTKEIESDAEMFVGGISGASGGGGGGGAFTIELDGDIIYDNQKKIAEDRGINMGMGVFGQ